MNKKAENNFTKFSEKPNYIFKLIKFNNKDEKDIEGGQRARRKNERLGFIKIDKKGEKSHGENLNKVSDYD